MVSNIHIDVLFASYLQLKLEGDDEETNWVNSIISHWNFQDTDDDNETECYFYFRDQLSCDEIRRFTNFINDRLQISSYPIVQNKSEDEEMRLEFIVSVGNRFGEKFK